MFNPLIGLAGTARLVTDDRHYVQRTIKVKDYFALQHFA